MQDINEAQFESEVLQSGNPVLVDFWAPWCGPCKQLTPVLEELATETPAVKFVKVNVDDNPMLAAQFGVRGIPALLYFKDGKVVDQKSGALPKQDIAAMFG